LAKFKAGKVLKGTHANTNLLVVLAETLATVDGLPL
jgi:hypothetical protein